MTERLRAKEPNAFFVFSIKKTDDATGGIDMEISNMSDVDLLLCREYLSARITPKFQLQPDEIVKRPGS